MADKAPEERREKAPLSQTPFQIAVGAKHALLLVESGMVYSFGENDSGQLGRSAGNDRAKFKAAAIDALRTPGGWIIQVAAGDRHSIALNQNGEVMTWGRNKSGQLGPMADRDLQHLLQTQAEEVPMKLRSSEFGKPGAKLQSVAASRHSTAAVTAGGQFYVWGEAGAYLREAPGLRTSTLGDSPARPLRIRADENDPGDDEDSVVRLQYASVSRDCFLCTVMHTELVEDLDDRGDRLKERMNVLRTEARKLRREMDQQQRERERNAGKEEEYGGIDQFKEMHADMDRVLKERIYKEIEDCETEIVRKKEQLRKFVRDIAVIDQHEAQNVAQFERLEAELSAFAKMPGDRSNAQAHALQTQLNDIRLFREVNRKQKFDLLNQKAELSTGLMKLESQRNLAEQTKLIFEDRKRLMRSLSRSPGGEVHKDDNVLQTCEMKMQSIVDSDISNLAQSPYRYNGLMECIAVSDRTIGDVYSSLKEVGMSSMTAFVPEAKIFESSLEFQCSTTRELNTRVRGAINRATDMLHAFHREMSANFDDLPVTTR